jgi:hypothetical protein
VSRPNEANIMRPQAYNLMPKLPVGPKRNALSKNSILKENIHDENHYDSTTSENSIVCTFKSTKCDGNPVVKCKTCENGPYKNGYLCNFHHQHRHLQVRHIVTQ